MSHLFAPIFWVVFGGVLILVRKQTGFWPLLALGLFLGFNFLFTQGFFHVEVCDGHLHGSLIDILNQGAKVMLVSLGMTLVIATGGVDPSVDAMMALAGGYAARLLVVDNAGFATTFFGALAIALVAGAWNGALVVYMGIQPIIATLILMVAGRGVAQLVTDGQIINFANARMVFLGNGHFLGLPFTLTVMLVMLAATWALTRRTALGLFIEAVGDNPTASRYAGVNARLVTFLAYLFTGLCAGLAGLVAASNIKGADANHAGLYLELDAILAVVVGGTALTGGRFYLVGSLVGALLIQTLTTTMYARNVSPDIAPMPKALVIIAVCLLQSEKARRYLSSRFPQRPAAGSPPTLTTALVGASSRPLPPSSREEGRSQVHPAARHGHRARAFQFKV